MAWSRAAWMRSGRDRFRLAGNGRAVQQESTANRWRPQFAQDRKERESGLTLVC